MADSIEKKGGFWAWVTGTPETAEAPAPPTQRSEPTQPETEQANRLMADNAALRAQIAKVQAERITSDAAAFVQAQIASGHAYPAEAAALTALYVWTAQSDPTGVQLLTAAIEARPANRLSGSLLPSALPPGAAVLTNGGGDSSLDEAEASARAYGLRANGKR